jgi:hypothetical protein
MNQPQILHYVLHSNWTDMSLRQLFEHFILDVTYFLEINDIIIANVFILCTGGLWQTMMNMVYKTQWGM